MEITITDRARTRIRDVARNEGVDLGTTYLRIAVVPGGCSGLTYDLGWDTTRQETDHYAEVDGVRVLIDRKSLLYLEGSELDFTDGLEGKGFHFINPQAIRTCACGESFGL
ncbi:iron-sulfur cluster assembly accessory protein [Rhodocaloribacter litoris]|uniref:HesB/IscA family protein n=1 Tax=Rhodocaloribacter litoris TaxID=2558931 RepID=UPI00141DFFDA|nr:iron-sulfur cluster assembly accessory protein [Rhodocaloribacter litoris]QXD14979.1 iron-sulfur cluster assembly accessory protein [Rhodocaloribacter litoris]GIV58916.1 MAG: heme biosynthesis protein HemY [Rhodothermaceae bacterium]